ncbi:MAG TPA: hypothetical protein VK929_13545 [Longimicrobiales bacterium]|nr:hypothetical protein [Longimicrobiales bacterium]
MRVIPAFLAVALGTTACAAPAQQAEPAPQPAQQAFDPSGTYDFTTDVQGTAVRGIMVIRRGDQGYTGSLTTDVTGELPFNRILFEGRRGELRAATPQGDMVMRIEFLDEDRFQGGWEVAGGMSGGATGTRRH